MPRYRHRKKKKKPRRHLTPEPYPEKIIHHGEVVVLGKDVENVIKMYKKESVLKDYYDIKIYQPIFSEKWIIEFLPKYLEI